MALIEVKNAIKTYQMGDELFYAMNDISFEIEKGDFVAIMGASDDNKSQIISNEIKVGDKVCISSTGGGKSKKTTGMRPPRI